MLDRVYHEHMCGCLQSVNVRSVQLWRLAGDAVQP